jgi:transcription initiation factor TFIIIB Brf1 subunit/transcription initiation factor TFIIB
MFLACKVEEVARRAVDVINVMHSCKLRRLQRPHVPLDVSSRAFDRWRSALVSTESIILKELGYDLYSIMTHPHNFILYYVKLLRGSQQLAQRAWSYLNDSMRLPLCVRFSPETIACAAIAMAAAEEGVTLPSSPPWHALLCPDADLAQLAGIAADIRQLYGMPKMTWLPSLRRDAAAGGGDDVAQ